MLKLNLPTGNIAKPEQPEELLISGRLPIRAMVFDPDRFDQVSGAIGELQQEAHHSLFSFGGVHARHVLPYVVEQIGPCKLFFTSWAISQASIQTILKLRDGGLMDLKGCILSDRVQKECPKAFQLLKANTDAIWLKKIHAKGFVAWNDQWHVSVKMTANFTENERAETFDIITAKAAFDVHLKWINKLCNERIE